MKTEAINTREAVRALRRLPPRERIHVIQQVLAELESDLGADPSSDQFWDDVGVWALADRQDVEPAEDLDVLLGGWPDDESVDDFVAAVREWRRQDLAMNAE